MIGVETKASGSLLRGHEEQVKVIVVGSEIKHSSLDHINVNVLVLTP